MRPGLPIARREVIQPGDQQLCRCPPVVPPAPADTLDISAPREDQKPDACFELCRAGNAAAARHGFPLGPHTSAPHTGQLVGHGELLLAAVSAPRE